ncbi:hypothetical protein [Acaryochloris sp. IP29b_bin.148]|uniref:hypothetical protein n=1 Tax=Acaryochloris sp. IP29b_bin.148 TaxID=2969218 RepID=UPI002620C173|nr:hypothetical protein [Acaryochloris sp. IP29b_bin.148]
MAQSDKSEQPILIAGPYDLNPGLHRPAQPERPKQQSLERRQPPALRPALPTITPESPPEQGPQGGAALSSEAQPTAQESDLGKQKRTPIASPAPPNSPLLIMSPAARPSGPVPHQLHPLATPLPTRQRPKVNQGGAIAPTPTDSPAARPSGPRSPLQQAPKPLTMTDPAPSRRRNSPASSSAVQANPHFRSLPTPPSPQNISPASPPALIRNDPPSPPPPVQSPELPLDLPSQQPQIEPPQRLPIDVAPIGAADDPQVPFIVLENATTDFKLDFDEFGKENLKIEETITFRLRNGDRATFTTGMNTYRQNDLEPVKNIPLILGWETEVGDVSVNVTAGAEVFNRLAPQPTFKVGAKTSLFGEVLVSGEVEHGPYKFNTTTLANEISYWRIRPSVFWQIDRKTTLFGLLQAGFFNDGNQEIQSFSRLERKIGPFAVAANLFTWNFAEDLEAESGYFSPLNFLLYNAEIGWRGKIFDPLSCQFAASIGNQVVNGDESTGRGLQTKCTVVLADNVELDFGYVFTNVISSGDGASNSHIFSGQLQIDF